MASFKSSDVLSDLQGSHQCSVTHYKLIRAIVHSIILLGIGETDFRLFVVVVVVFFSFFFFLRMTNKTLLVILLSSVKL